MHEQITEEIYKDFGVTFTKFFENIESNNIRANISWLTFKLSPVHLIERQNLYAENENIDAIYFVQTGTLDFISPRFKS